MPRPRKKEVGATEPLLTCPFTGIPVELVYSDTLMMHQIRGPFYQTKWYAKRADLLWEFSTRNGVLPSYENHSITSAGLVEPPPRDITPALTQPLSDAASDFVDRIVEGKVK